MPEERVETEAAAEPLMDALPEGDAPFKTAEPDEPVEEITEKEAEPPAAAEEPSTSEEKTDEGEDEAAKIIKSAEKKDNVQKRFDQLTARLKALEEENLQLKHKVPEKKSDEPEYTDAQLKNAMKKAVEEGDHELMLEIMEYREKRLEKNLVKRYEEAEKAKYDKQRQIDQEWEKVQTDYSKTWQDENGKEIYPGARRDLDLSHGNTLLYKVAYDLFNMREEDGSYPYRVPGGQRMAVADALAAILKQKKLTPQDGKVKQLERALGKEKRKKALTGSRSIEEESTPRRPLSDTDRLQEVIEERKQYQTERGA